MTARSVRSIASDMQRVANRCCLKKLAFPKSPLRVLCQLSNWRPISNGDIILAMPKPSGLLQGTLDLLILRTVELRPLYGVGIADRIEQVTCGTFVVGAGSLFPALHRLAEKDWIKGQWTELESGRRVKVYALTRAGRAQLANEKRNWQKIVTAMGQVLAQEA